MTCMRARGFSQTYVCHVCLCVCSHSVSSSRAQPNARVCVQMQNPNVPGTAIFIDSFHRPARGAATYILTHCHNDHMAGLHANWKSGLLHCTEVSARLLTYRWPRGTISKVLRVHDFEEAFGVDDPAHPGQQVTCTFVDASHCPGAAVVVLEGALLRLLPLRLH